MYMPIFPIEGSNGFYAAFATVSDEDSRQALIEQWTTPEQREYNASTVQCRSCKGRGYRTYRLRGALVREGAGCSACLGLGKVAKAGTDNSDGQSFRSDDSIEPIE